jgi:hypothetical protein
MSAIWSNTHSFEPSWPPSAGENWRKLLGYSRASDTTTRSSLAYGFS